jgi:hypothetical protein
MISYTTEIVLDISGNSQAEVIAKQDDNNTRFLSARFVDDSSSISLSDVSSAECRILRPDGLMVTQEATLDTKDGTVSLFLSEKALAAAGRGYGDIRLLGSNGECLSATRFVLTVLPSAVSNNKLSTESVFENYSKEVATLKNSLNGMTITKISKEDYDALESPDENTIYYVVDDSGKITQYLGSTELSNGKASTAGLMVLITSGVATAKTGTYETVTNTEG